MGIIFSFHDSTSGLQSIKISASLLFSHLSAVTNSYLKPPGGAESVGRRVLGAALQSVGEFSLVDTSVTFKRSQVKPAEVSEGYKV